MVPTIYQPGATGKNGMWPIFPSVPTSALMQDPRTGAVWQNPLKSRQKWYWLVGNEYQLTLEPGNVQSVLLSPGLEDGTLGDFEMVKLVSYNTGTNTRFACRIFDPFLDRWLSNAPVASDFMFGVPEYPGTFYESIFIPASTNLELQIQSLEADAFAICIAGSGRRFMGCGPRDQIWQAFRDRKTHPYWLTFDTGPEFVVAANSTGRATMTVPAGGDFDAWTLMDDSYRTSNKAVAEYSINILEGSSGRSMLGLPPGESSAEISIIAAKSRLVSGVNGDRLRAVGNPTVMTFTHLFPARTQVQLDLVNPNAFEITVRLAFHGQMIYAGQCPPGDPSERMLETPVGYMPVPGAQPCGPQNGCLPWGAPTQQSFTTMPTAMPTQNQSPRQNGYGGQQQWSPPVLPGQGQPQGPILGPGYGAGWAFGGR